MSRPYDHLAITCKRWFQKSYGNTYHSVEIVDRTNGKQLAYSGFNYGYERACVETAVEVLNNMGYDISYNTIEAQVAYINIIDVNRKKDL